NGVSLIPRDSLPNVAILSASETSVTPSCITLRSAEFVAAASWMPEQCRCRGPFRDLKIALTPMLPSATWQFRFEVAFSPTSPIDSHVCDPKDGPGYYLSIRGGATTTGVPWSKKCQCLRV